MVHTLVIGGTKGIGKAFVSTITDHQVSIIARKSLENSANNVTYFTADITDNKSVEKVIPEIVKRNGKITGLVFFQRYRGDGDSLQGGLDTSVTATKNIIEACKDHFDRPSSVVLVSSTCGYFIAEGQSLGYHLEKAAMNMIARFYAHQLGRKGIRVNSISPSAILKDENREFYVNNTEIMDLYKKITPVGRMGNTEDVSHVVHFLLSDKSSFINGQNINVDGGVSLEGQESLARELLKTLKR